MKIGGESSHKQYSLSAARKESVASLPFPRNRREVQSVMGVANMFLKFTPKFSLLAAPLKDMTSKHFSSDEVSWTTDYHAVFSTGVLNYLLSRLRARLGHPWWFSDRGCDAILFQRRPITFTYYTS
jgi:hypothetical protein